MKLVQSTFVSRERLLPAASVGIVLGICELLAAQTTGTFIDRHRPTDLRVVSYNVFNDTIFSNTDAGRAAKFSRVMKALNPDIVNLQEIYVHTAIDVVDLMNNILPPAGGATWYAQHAPDNVIVSRFPLSLQRTNTDPNSPRNIAIALVDLPNEQFGSDFYFMNNHFRCCGAAAGPENAERQRQADALVNWMRDARSPGGFFTLPPDTPMAVVGDLNMVGSLNPLNTLISGNIVNENAYGTDSSPDWDSTPLADAHPLHNVDGPDSYTFRSDSSLARLDFILYTDSAASVAKKFVLNTVTMSPAERAATGLQAYDITLDNAGNSYDHFPLIVDFRLVSLPMPGDYNSDKSVTSADYNSWMTSFASTQLSADGNRDGVVDAADYAVWRKAFAATAVATGQVTAVPEPASKLLCIIVVTALVILRFARHFPSAN